MAQEVFVALFETIGEAEDAKRDLEAAGFPSADITARARDASEVRHDEGGFWDWLFGREPEYRTPIEDRGAAVLTIHADSEHYDRVTYLLRGHRLVETGQDTIQGQQTTMAPADSQAAGETETVIPTAREELKVGKRLVTDTHSYLIRRHTTARPVEEQVTLHQETVAIERRQPTALSGAGEHPFEDKIVEVTETREEPVVSKDVIAGEEVVVRRAQEDRTETIRDTVRETKVDVERAAAGDKPSSKP
jgi:stress response protein YsnF